MVLGGIDCRGRLVDFFGLDGAQSAYDGGELEVDVSGSYRQQDVKVKTFYRFGQLFLADHHLSVTFYVIEDDF